jgi:hypothetical protein
LDGKASTVQFVHFPFTDKQAAAFSTENTEIILGFSHTEYGHMVLLPEARRAALAKDFA